MDPKFIASKIAHLIFNFPDDANSLEKLSVILDVYGLVFEELKIYEKGNKI